MPTAFGYELNTRPTSLFDKDDLMNEADKPKIKHALLKLLPETLHAIPTNSKYVLDSGLLLKKYHGLLVTHLQRYMYKDICQAYVTIVKRNRKTVWKHRQNWPFYTPMLRNKLF